MRTITKAAALAAATVFMTTTAANALVTFDPDTGAGFVGKGDVQLALVMNNTQLQKSTIDWANAFAAVSTTVTEVSWICTNSNNDNIQERERTTTESIQGLVASVARENSKGKDGAITGFRLLGYSGTPTTDGSSTEGPKLNSCPSGPWSLTTPAGDAEVISSSSALTVNGVPLQ